MTEPRQNPKPGPQGIGRWHGLVIDSDDPAGLASFYERLLGMVRIQHKDDWVVIGDSADRPGLGFSLNEAHQAPPAPDPGQPGHLHLDIRVDDLEAAEAAILSGGGARVESGDSLHGPPGDQHRVFTDPAGHPFCIITL
jgi:catechol 2,3-dioxygenase-like lactoylglutathione lyase family enzyme